VLGGGTAEARSAAVTARRTSPAVSWNEPLVNEVS